MFYINKNVLQIMFYIIGALLWLVLPVLLLLCLWGTSRGGLSKIFGGKFTPSQPYFKLLNIWDCLYFKKNMCSENVVLCLPYIYKLQLKLSAIVSLLSTVITLNNLEEATKIRTPWTPFVKQVNFDGWSFLQKNSKQIILR